MVAGELMTDLVPLFLLLAGIAGLAVIVRRFLPLLGQRYRPGSPLKHLGTLVLTPQCSVALVRAGQEMLVLGLTPHSVTLLTKADGAEMTRGNGDTEKRGYEGPGSHSLSVSPLLPFSDSGPGAPLPKADD